MTKQKQDLTSAKIASENIVLRCGQCMHFRGSAHPSIGTPCQSSGVKSYAIAPNCYTPDVHQLKGLSTETFSVLSAIVAACKPQQAMILMGLFREHASLHRKTGFSLMQKVYFSLGSGEFLSDYYAGFVLGLAPHERVLIVGTQYFSNQRSSMVASLDVSSVLDRSKFEKRARRLINTGRVNPPRAREPMEVPPDVAKYEPPTIESSQEILEQNAAGKTAKRGGKKVLVIEDRT